LADTLRATADEFRVRQVSTWNPWAAVTAAVMVKGYLFLPTLLLLCATTPAVSKPPKGASAEKTVKKKKPRAVPANAGPGGMDGTGGMGGIGSMGSGMAGMIFPIMDKNKDQKISKEEFDAMGGAEEGMDFAQMDKDGDGFVSRKESDGFFALLQAKFVQQQAEHEGGPEAVFEELERQQDEHMKSWGLGGMPNLQELEQKLRANDEL
jgi:hypothetical protein